MKKFAGITAAGLGLIAAGFAAPSQAAAPETHISGNLQYTSMSYWCDGGTPNFAFTYRTLNKTEAKVTFSASGYQPYVSSDVDPYWASEVIYSGTPHANTAITVHGVGSTTGSSFSVSGKTPATCKGLPTERPAFDWAAQGKPTAQPVPSSTSTTPVPTKTTPAPTKTTPAPSKTTPAPTKSSTSSTTTVTPTPTKSSSAPVKTTTAPATSMPTAPATSGKGPKVDTDHVATNNDTALYAMAAGAGAVALAGAGTVAARRRK